MHPTQNLTSFIMNTRNVPVPPDLDYPCFCAGCAPRPPRRPHPSTMPLDAFIPPVVNSMMEMHTPLHCRKHSGGKSQIIVPTRTTKRTRYLRTLAFLYRLMTFAHYDPDPAIHVRLYVNRERARCSDWLPVPLSTFDPVLTDAHGIRLDLLTDRARHLDAHDNLARIVADLFGTPLYETWHVPAEIAAKALAVAMYDPSVAPAARCTAEYASLKEVWGSDHDGVRMAERVAWNPYPQDQWPWVPGWAPTQWTSTDHTVPPGSCVIPADERRWWNWSGNPTPWLY